jgi:hypothetical protein
VAVRGWSSTGAKVVSRLRICEYPDCGNVVITFEEPVETLLRQRLRQPAA